MKERSFSICATVFPALLVAGSQTSFDSIGDLASVYAYWLTRLGLAAALFFGVREILRAAQFTQPHRHLHLVVTIAAIVISLPAFTLAVTALDLVLGLPEMGIGTIEASGVPTDRILPFLMEMLYQADNHIAFCLLLSLSHWLTPLTRTSLDVATAEAADKAPPQQVYGFLATHTPAITHPVQSVEAQEHYVRVATAQDSYMILCRFSDILRELPADQGLRIHRSRWVSFTSITGVLKQGKKMLLILSDGTRAPVSAPYRSAVETYLKETDFWDTSLTER